MASFEVTAAPAPSKRQIMLATESTKRVSTVEDLDDENLDKTRDKGKVEHTTDGRVTLWQPVRDRWIPKTVAVANMSENFDMGWRTECGNCGTTHGIEEDAIRGADINACPAIPKLPTAYCPRCGAPFHDTGEIDQAKGERDPEAINLYEKTSTPETRLRGQMDLHILVYHPADALGYGVTDNRPPVGQIV